MNTLFSGGNILRNFFIIAVLISNISCDQISKMIVRGQISEDEEISIIANHLTLTRVENTGAFLSLGSELPALMKSIILSFIPIVAITLALVYIFRERQLSRMTLAGYAFVIGGGIGNLFDRVWYGSVTDFVHIDFGLFETGIFNMADVSIMMGIGFLIINTIRKKSIMENEPAQN
jgi:signal peptidase II